MSPPRIPGVDTHVSHAVRISVYFIFSPRSPCNSCMYRVAVAVHRIAMQYSAYSCAVWNSNTFLGYSCCVVQTAECSGSSRLVDVPYIGRCVGTHTSGMCRLSWRFFWFQLPHCTWHGTKFEFVHFVINQLPSSGLAHKAGYDNCRLLIDCGHLSRCMLLLYSVFLYWLCLKCS
jgi:hypothetical protein